MEFDSTQSQFASEAGYLTLIRVFKTVPRERLDLFSRQSAREVFCYTFEHGARINRENQETASG
jgi:hypothetical protein